LPPAGNHFFCWSNIILPEIGREMLAPAGNHACCWFPQLSFCSRPDNVLSHSSIWLTPAMVQNNQHFPLSYFLLILCFFYTFHLSSVDYTVNR
jgi:hypothetical protein